MKLGKNKYFLLYLGTWGALLILGSLTETGMEPTSLVMATAVLALVVPLLILVCDKVGADAPAGAAYTVHRMGDGEVICTVDGMWICRGSEEKATWYLRGKKVYSFEEKQYLYRVEKGLVYRRGEEQPCMKIEEDLISRLPDGEVLYQTAKK